MISKLEQKEVPSALTLPECSKVIAWFCVLNDFKEKKTKNGKDFITATIADNEGNTNRIKIWGSLDTKDFAYTLWLAEVSMQADWGLSTNAGKMRRLTAFE